MKSRNDEEITYTFPIISIFHGALLLIPLLIVDYVITTKNFINMLPFLYSVASAGWLITLGNGRLSINIERCKNVVDISSKKWKSWFVITSAKEYCLSKVDYYFQFIGYLMIPIGVMLSIVVIYLQKTSNIDSNWLSFDNIYTTIFLLYIFLLVVIATILRIYFLIYDALWYKKNENK